MSQTIEIVIGSGSEFDPGAGASAFVIPSLAGAVYHVERGGFGRMPSSTYVDNPLGGFALQGGLATSSGEVWFVIIGTPGNYDAFNDYTNGFNHSAVVAALKDRIGFRQPLGTGVPTLSSAVTTTRSGRYFQDFHALVTVENIKATMPQVSASDADLITYLGQIRSAAILRSLNGVFTAPQVVDQPMWAFTRDGEQTLENSTGKFCGYEIYVADSPDAAVQIEAVRLMLDSAATFNLYVFEDGKTAPIWTEEVTTEAGSVTEITVSGLVLNRGTYWIGYFQNDLGGAKAYREEVAGLTEGILYAAGPMVADATGPTSFERDEISYVSPTYGINVELSSFRDYTHAVKKKAAMFDELIGLNLAYSVLEQVIYAVRSNVNERILKDQLAQVGIQMDLNGAAPISDSPQITGLRQRIDRELRRVKESFYPNPKSVVLTC